MAVKDAMIRARVKSTLKNEAEAVFERLGLNPTEAITLFYTQVTIKKGIPFNLDLEENDTPNQYISVNSDDELRTIMNL